MLRLGAVNSLTAAAAAARGAVLFRGSGDHGRSAAASSTFLLASRRHNVFASGKTYHPTGQKLAAQALPLNHPHFIKECNHLAKSAHASRNFGDAVSLYDRVLASRRNEFGLVHLECAATLHNIGRVFIDMREYGGAESALSEAAAIYEKLEGPHSLKYADSLGLLALCYRDLKWLDESEKAFKEALSVYRDACYNHKDSTWLPTSRVVPDAPNESPLSSVAHLLADCAGIFVVRDQNHRAAVFLEEALEIRRFLYTHHTKFRPIIAQTLAKLAEVKRVEGNIEQAELYINECVEICLLTMGREAPATAAAISSKGNIHAVRQQFREAKKCYEEAITTYALSYGKQSPLVASEMLHLGRMQELLGDLAAAEKTFVRASEIIRAAHGGDHPQLADANMFLAALVMKKADYDRAIPLLRDCVRIRTHKTFRAATASAAATEDPALVFTYHKLGDALAAKRDPEAEAHFLHAIEIYRMNISAGKGDSQRLLMTDVLDDLGLHYLQFHMHERAEASMREALEIRLERLGESSPMAAYSYSNLSLVYLDKKDYANCETSCKAALKIYDAAKQDTWMAASDAYMTLGQCYSQQQMWGEALKTLSRSLNMRRTHGETAHIQVAETLHEIVKVKIALGETAEASTMLEEASALAEKFQHLTTDLRAAIERTKRSFPAVASG